MHFQWRKKQIYLLFSNYVLFIALFKNSAQLNPTKQALTLEFNGILIWQPCHRWLPVACRSFCFGCWRRSARKAGFGLTSLSVPSEMPLPRKIKSGICTPHLQCAHWSTLRQIGDSLQISTPSILGIKLKNLKRPLRVNDSQKSSCY